MLILTLVLNGTLLEAHLSDGGSKKTAVSKINSPDNGELVINVNAVKAITIPATHLTMCNKIFICSFRFWDSMKLFRFR